MKKSKFILSIVLALSANTVIAGGGSDDSPHSQLKSCFKSQKQEASSKKSIRIISLGGADLTPEKNDDEKQFDTIPVPDLKSSNLEDRFKTRAALLTLLEVPDSEWEFGISTLRFVLGLSTEISERHEHWAVNSYREVDLLLDALEIIFEQPVKFKEKQLFSIGISQHRQRIENQMAMTRYYEYQASHEFFDAYQEKDSITMDPAQLKSHRNFKKLSLQKSALDYLNERSIAAERFLKKIIKRGTVGDLEKRKTIFDHLGTCYHKNVPPQVIFTNLSEEDGLILNRFVIAVKERLFCFITPEEGEIIEEYDDTFEDDSSSESEEPSSTESDSDYDV